MAESTRMRALQNLAGQIPVASQRIATGQKAARDIQLQQAVQKAAPTTQIIPTAQQTGTALTQQQGQQAVQNVQQGTTQLGQVGQLGLAEQQRENQANIASLQAGAREEQLDQAQRLGKLDAQLKQELYDNTMKFEKDELGRTMFNEQQLLDYARSSAVSDEQLKNYQQTIEQAARRQEQALEHAAKLVIEDLNKRYSEARARSDFHATAEIDRQRKEAEAEIQKQKNKAANRTATASAVGGIVGAVVGGVYGGPGGAAVGGAGGSAAGKAVAQ